MVQRQKQDSKIGLRVIDKIMFHVEHLPSEIVQKLKLYEQTLLKWQKAINLVSRGTLNDIWHRHIEDSIQIFPLISGEYWMLVLEAVSQEWFWRFLVQTKSW